MRRVALALCPLLPVVALGQACNPALPGGTQLESRRFLLGFRTEPASPKPGKYFAVEISVCPKAGVPAPGTLAVDAVMPEHGHGMNYKAQLNTQASGHYVASGLMFHMPGRWELFFDVRSGDRTDRLMRTIIVQ